MKSNYIVLARKYRPITINDLKGQDVLVTTLKNAFNNNRIAHAFLLSGVRGIGKTTTARILAKALNCIGQDGNGNPTLEPCNICIHCTNINNDSHLDVLEMDAASKTGIDDIREIIETVKYKPLSARYKVYIIDEIHMLSKSAFNALLKTLEEPPEYVKFIFATTEIKKVPITIISRCQRFDLRRLTSLEIQEHLSNICIKENVTFENAALLLIANAAEGSVRDSLSILDQAINISNNNITEDIILKMLGKGSIKEYYELFSALTQNDHKVAIEIFNNLYNNGLDIISIFEELLVICHLVTMIKTTLNPNNDFDKNHVIQNPFLTDIEKKYTITLAEELSLNGLIVLWQLLIKGIEEIKISLLPKKSAEMIILRITWVNEISTLPQLKKVLHLSQIGNNNLESKNSIANNIDNNCKKDPIKESTLLNTNNKEDVIPKPEPEESNITEESNNVTLEDVLELFPEAKVIK